jgi:ribulose-5-phosphate 4-epimerase/fuculose-1-phosphate aldolase
MLDSVGKRVSIYQPEQPGLIFPEIPSFASVGEEREHRKKHLVAAVRAFAEHGFDYGFAGHLTVRDPEHTDLYWTNPVCVHFSQVKLSNLILADHTGHVVEGKYAINRAGFVLHSAVHASYPDIVAMCHAHTIHGTAWCAMGRPLDMISQDAACFYDDQVVIGASAGAVAVEKQVGMSFARAFGKHRAALHQNHGLITSSRHSIDAAAFWFIALERCCQVQLLVEASGVKPQVVPEASARYSHEHIGNDFIAWMHFQTIFNHLVETQPDMFD